MSETHKIEAKAERDGLGYVVERYQSGEYRDVGAWRDEGGEWVRSHPTEPTGTVRVHADQFVRAYTDEHFEQLRAYAEELTREYTRLDSLGL